MPSIDPHLAFVLLGEHLDDRRLALHAESFFFQNLGPRAPSIRVRSFTRFAHAAEAAEHALPRLLLVTLRPGAALTPLFGREVSLWGSSVVRYPDKPAPFDSTTTFYFVDPALRPSWTGCLGPHDRRFPLPFKIDVVRAAVAEVFGRSATRGPIGHRN